MTLRPDLTPTDEELAPGFERLWKAFQPDASDPTFLVLKSHLLFEELLRDFLSKHLRHPQAVHGARLSFAQVLKFCQALATTLDPSDWRWRALIELNRLRNSLAHEFVSESIDTIVARIVDLVGPEIGGKFPRIDQAPRNPDTGAAHPQVFGLAVIGLYSSLAVRLGFDANFRFVVDKQRSEEVFAILRKRNEA